MNIEKVVRRLAAAGHATTFAWLIRNGIVYAGDLAELAARIAKFEGKSKSDRLARTLEAAAEHYSATVLRE
jgi:hypothetical protein